MWRVCGVCLVLAGCAGLGAGTVPAEQDAGEGAVAQQPAHAAEPAQAALERLSRIETIRAPSDWTPVWEVTGGTTLGEVLGEWGDRADVEIVMFTDRVYEIASSHQFTGSFEDAVDGLLLGLGDLAYAPIGQMSGDGRVLTIYHRVPERRGQDE